MSKGYSSLLLSIPLLLQSIVPTTAMQENNQWLGRNIVWSTGRNNSQESIDRCTGCCTVPAAAVVENGVEQYAIK